MKKPKLRELGEAVKALIRGPYTPKHFIVPPENLRGMAKFYPDDCIGCCACAEVCPSGCIKVVHDLDRKPPIRRLTVWTDQCIVCGQCERYCTTRKGIRLTPEYDTTTGEAHMPRVPVEKELMLCESCGEIIGAVDHMKWIALKVGSKSYANPALMAALHPELRQVMTPVGLRAAEDRSDLMRPVCTACRRRSLALEVWG